MDGYDRDTHGAASAGAEVCEVQPLAVDVGLGKDDTA